VHPRCFGTHGVLTTASIELNFLFSIFGAAVKAYKRISADFAEAFYPLCPAKGHVEGDFL